MSATMLQIVQQVSAELGLAVPSSVAGNQTTDVIQILSLTNAVGYELQRQHQWQRLTKEYTFTTQYLNTVGTWTTSAATVSGIPSTSVLAATTWSVAAGSGILPNTQIQSVDSATQVTLANTPTVAGSGAVISFAQTMYAFPSDFDRLIDKTDWDKTKRWEALGPETAQQWQWLKSGYISTGPRIRFRPLGGYFQVFPPTVSNELMGFEYVGNKWVLALADTITPTKTALTVDTDTCVFPDRLMVLGTKLKYFEIKGFDTAALYRDYLIQLDLAKSHDAGSPTLSFAPRESNVLITSANIPDSGYGT